MPEQIARSIAYACWATDAILCPFTMWELHVDTSFGHEDLLLWDEDGRGALQ